MKVVMSASGCPFYIPVEWHKPLNIVGGGGTIIPNLTAVIRNLCVWWSVFQSPVQILPFSKFRIGRQTIQSSMLLGASI